MDVVTISPKYQIVIPAEVRERLNLRPGQKVGVVVWRGMLTLVPVKRAQELRGFAKGIDTTREWDTEEP